MKMPHYLLKSTYILIVIVVFSCNQEKNQDEKVTAVVQEPIVVYKNIHGFSEKDYEFDSSFVKSGESFGEILQRMDISYSSINKLSTTYKDVYDIRRIYPGDKYYTLRTKDSLKSAKLIYQHSPTELVVMNFVDSVSLYVVNKPIIMICNDS